MELAAEALGVDLGGMMLSEGTRERLSYSCFLYFFFDESKEWYLILLLCEYEGRE